MLLPASLQDWLPKGHLAYFISDTVDALDLKAFYARYAGGGARNQPFHPAMMVKLLVYGCAICAFCTLLCRLLSVAWRPSQPSRPCAASSRRLSRRSACPRLPWPPPTLSVIGPALGSFARCGSPHLPVLAELPTGWIKSVVGLRQFSLRGLHRVQAEFKLVCMALNLRRMGAMRAV